MNAMPPGQICAASGQPHTGASWRSIGASGRQAIRQSKQDSQVKMLSYGDVWAAGSEAQAAVARRFSRLHGGQGSVCRSRALAPGQSSGLEGVASSRWTHRNPLALRSAAVRPELGSKAGGARDSAAVFGDSATIPRPAGIGVG